MAELRNSFSDLNWAASVVGVGASHKAVLWALANQAHGTGRVAKFHIATLGRQCNLMERRARSIARDLERWDLIKRIPRTYANGFQVANSFLLNRDRLFPKSSEGEKIGAHVWERVLGEMLARLEFAPIIEKNISVAFFQGSQRGTRTGQRHGTLYLFAKNPESRKILGQYEKWIIQMRAAGAPFLIDWIKFPTLGK